MLAFNFLADRAKKTRTNKLYVFLFLGLLMSFAAVFSFLALAHQSLRLDEAQSLWQTSRSLQGVLSTVAQDVHVPLYHILLHFWQLFFGNDVATVRVLSFAFFVFTIPAVYFLGRAALGSKEGLFAAAMVAASPFMSWFGSEIRMYSLLALLTVLNQYFFICIYKYDNKKTNQANSLYKLNVVRLLQAGLSKGERTINVRSKPNIDFWWWGYTISAILGIFSHYFFIFILASQAVFIWLSRRSFRTQSFYLFAAVGFLLSALLSLWFYYVKNLGLSVNTVPLLPQPDTVNLFSTFSNFLFGFQSDSLNTFILSLWPVAVLLGFVSLRRSLKIPGEVKYLFLASIFPIVAAFTASILWRPIYLTRYLILSVPSFYLILVWLLTSTPKKISIFLHTLVAVSMVFMLTMQTTSASTPVFEDYKGVSDYLAEQAAPEDIIVVSAPFTIYPILYYYKGPSAVSSIPAWNRYQIGPIPSLPPEELPAQVERVSDKHRRLWLILSYDQGNEEGIRLYFEKNYKRLMMKEFSPGLSLYIYQLRYDEL